MRRPMPAAFRGLRLNLIPEKTFLQCHIFTPGGAVFYLFRSFPEFSSPLQDKFLHFLLSGR